MCLFQRLLLLFVLTIYSIMVLSKKKKKNLPLLIEVDQSYFAKNITQAYHMFFIPRFLVYA